MIAPADAPLDLVDPDGILRDEIVDFSIPEPITGAYTVQLRDPGRLGNDPVTPDKAWNIPVTVS